MRARILLLSIFLLVSTSCLGMLAIPKTTEVRQKGNPEVGDGAFVPFAKLMNPQYARNYIGASIKTNVVFYNSSATNVPHRVPKNHFVFQVLVPGQGPGTQAFTGAPTGYLVIAPDSFSNLIFSLSQGEHLELTGGTKIFKTGSLFTPSEWEFKGITFFATHIQK